jgi:hypothetical protein
VNEHAPLSRDLVEYGLNTPLFAGFLRDSIHYVVIAALCRDKMIEDPNILDDTARDDPESWWRLVKAP